MDCSRASKSEKMTGRILRGFGINIIVRLPITPLNKLKSHLRASGEVLCRYASDSDDKKVGTTKQSN